jgi:hypothetical protein
MILDILAIKNKITPMYRFKNAYVVDIKIVLEIYKPI